MTLICPQCDNKYELTRTQKFNYLHGISKNPTCGARCNRLYRIMIEADKNRFMIVDRVTKKRVKCKKYFKTQEETRLAIKKLGMWNRWMSCKM